MVSKETFMDSPVGSPPPGQGCAFRFLATFFVYLLSCKIVKNITTPTWNMHFPPLKLTNSAPDEDHG